MVSHGSVGSVVLRCILSVIMEALYADLGHLAVSRYRLLGLRYRFPVLALNHLAKVLYLCVNTVRAVTGPFLMVFPGVARICRAYDHCKLLLVIRL
jgi:K+ transporter